MRKYRRKNVAFSNEYLKEYNNECKLLLEAYLNACDIVSNNILELLQEKQIDKGDVLLIGVARGGLPLLVGVSHRTGIRNISTIQVKMNKSDNKDDYGKAEILNFNYDNSKKYYIVFEDIIYKGQSVNLILDSLKEERKKVLSVYSLVIDEDFLNTHVFNSLWTIVDDCDMLIILMKYLINQGIPVGKFKYTTINKVPYFKKFIVNKQDSMINSEYIREHSMFLPLYENITKIK